MTDRQILDAFSRHLTALLRGVKDGEAPELAAEIERITRAFPEVLPETQAVVWKLVFAAALHTVREFAPAP